MGVNFSTFVLETEKSNKARYEITARGARIFNKPNKFGSQFNLSQFCKEIKQHTHLVDE